MKGLSEDVFRTGLVPRRRPRDNAQITEHMGPHTRPRGVRAHLWDPQGTPSQFGWLRMRSLGTLKPSRAPLAPPRGWACVAHRGAGATSARGGLDAGPQSLRPLLRTQDEAAERLRGGLRARRGRGRGCGACCHFSGRKWQPGLRARAGIGRQGRGQAGTETSGLGVRRRFYRASPSDSTRPSSPSRSF